MFAALMCNRGKDCDPSDLKHFWQAFLQHAATMFIYSRRDNVSRPLSTAKLLWRTFTCASAELPLFFQSVQERTKQQVSELWSLEMDVSGKPKRIKTFPFFPSNTHLQVKWQVRQHQQWPAASSQQRDSLMTVLTREFGGQWNHFLFMKKAVEHE